MNISSLQRKQMIDLNLNPLNEEHVSRFLAGDIPSEKEIMLENIKRLGNIANRNNLGSRADKTFNVDINKYLGESEIPQERFGRENSQITMEDVRAEMEGYSTIKKKQIGESIEEYNGYEGEELGLEGDI